jgi:ubiquinone/menaquinone biosynthesis C-methylase UbiE
MEPKLQRWVQQRGWDRAAEHYETFWREQLRPAHDGLLDAAQLRPGEQVIDVACGTGMVTFPAARAVGPTGAVLATDISQRMVDDTAKGAADLGLENVAVRRCDAEHLGDVGAFDVALCALGLMYVPEPAVALDEMARALRPGGRVVIAVWGERRNCGWAELFPIVDARVSTDVCPMFFALGTPGALVSLAERTGFVDVEEHRISTELRYDDAASAIGAAFLGGPVALAHSRFDDATRASAYAEYLQSIARFRAGSGYRVPGEFVIVSGRTPHPLPPPKTDN